MKLKNYLLALILTISSTSLFAQNAYLTVSQLMNEYYDLGLFSGETSSNIYTVRGCVTKWVSGYPTYQNASFYIDDTETGSTTLLQCYRLTAANDADKHRLNVGDYVEITAYLQNYNEKAELVSGTFTIQQEATAEYKGETTIANFLAQADMKNIYQLTGVVSDVEDNAFGNFNLTDHTGSIYIYGLLNANGESGDFRNMNIGNGDTLTLQGIYTLYKNTPEIVNAQYISHIKDSQASQYMGETTIAQFLNSTDFKNSYQLKGVVSCHYSYGNCEFLLSDETESVYIQSLLNEGGDVICNQFSSYHDIYNGDTVTIRAILPENNYYSGCSAVGLTIPTATFISRTIPSKATGTCGDNIIVTLDPATLTLSFVGTGEMDRGIEWNNRTTIKVNDVEHVTFSESITTITNFGEYYTCPKVTTITLPQSLTTIADYAFIDWNGLQSVSFPESLTTIGNKAFSGCVNLNYVTIPRNVTYIGLGAFYLCSNLSRFIVVSNNQYYTTENGILFNKDKSVLCAIIANNTGQYQVPNTVKTIQPYAFSNCRQLQSVTMGNNVTIIHGAAFYGCQQLTDLNLPDSLEYIGYDLITDTPLYNNDNLWDNGVLYLNNYLLYAYRDLGSTFETIPEEYEIKDGTKVIAEYAIFDTDDEIKKLTIPTTVEYIGIYGISALSLEEVVWNATNCHDFVMTDYKGNVHYYGMEYNESSYADLQGAIDYFGGYGDHPIAPSDGFHIPKRVVQKTDTIPDHEEEENNDDEDDYYTPKVKNITFAANVEHLPASLCRGLKKLESITAFMPEPITISDDMFEQVDKQTCILYVPKGSKEKYESAPVWRDFYHIIETENTSGFDEIENVTPNLTNSPQKLLRNGTLYILKDGKTYNALGTEIQ